jgi:hypothetical protein
MGYWEHADQPFYYSLASTFPIADRYFSSVLGQTYPNRRYLMAATSLGMVNDANANDMLDLLDFLAPGFPQAADPGEAAGQHRLLRVGGRRVGPRHDPAARIGHRRTGEEYRRVAGLFRVICPCRRFRWPITPVRWNPRNAACRPLPRACGHQRAVTRLPPNLPMSYISGQVTRPQSAAERVKCAFGPARVSSNAHLTQWLGGL